LHIVHILIPDLHILYLIYTYTRLAYLAYNTRGFVTLYT